ncbi:MAG: glycosyltransferase family 4 protein [Fimbriimonadaceae bacterium]|nr:MAG: glycosyltransferase family 4 protein [Fimbriimonadaceae bacterium]
MRVTLVGRYYGGIIEGGAEIQMAQVKKMLGDLGHDAKILRPEEKDLGDIVHFFGAMDYFWNLAEICIERKVPYIVSPIWYRGGSLASIKKWRFLRTLEGRFSKKTKHLLKNAAKIVVPSPDVIGRIHVAFDAPKEKCVCIPSGAVSEQFLNDALSPTQQSGDYILCVANFLDRKNQLGLIEAMKGSGKRLVFAGGVSDSNYYQQCQKAAESDPNIVFLGAVGRSVLPSLVKNARVFCVPSFVDDFLIAGVEAGCLGVPLVLSNEWNAQEIYDKWAAYPNPKAPVEIKDAIESAWQKPNPVPGQTEWFLERYSEHAVRDQYQALYEQII